MTHLKEGDKAPGFDLLVKDKSKKTILYFYPKNNTPGCTNEACNLRDNFSELEKNGFNVIGVSPDSEQSHEKFKSKHNLPFELIADSEKELLNSYGIWGEKKNYGRTYMGVHRMTFIINKEGIIEKIFEKVKTKEHAEQIFKSYEA